MSVQWLLFDSLAEAARYVSTVDTNQGYPCATAQTWAVPEPVDGTKFAIPEFPGIPVRTKRQTPAALKLLGWRPVPEDPMAP